AELGRFAVRVPGIAEGLLYAAILHASRYGCVWGIGEVKPAMMRRYAKMGVVVMPIEGEPIIENVPPGARPYYAPPAPQLAAIAFAHTAMALQEKVVQCVANGTI
ncbi:MAG: hypothetical protein M1282_08310, partial [Chloroflexi bacterium]|nr:hypothetical protein [Chloroflexota bacterium]